MVSAAPSCMFIAGITIYNKGLYIVVVLGNNAVQMMSQNASSETWRKLIGSSSKILYNEMV